MCLWIKTLFLQLKMGVLASNYFLIPALHRPQTPSWGTVGALGSNHIFSFEGRQTFTQIFGFGNFIKRTLLINALINILSGTQILVWLTKIYLVWQCYNNNNSLSSYKKMYQFDINDCLSSALNSFEYHSTR